MKLSEYFKSQNTNISQHQKLAIFTKIIHKQSQYRYGRQHLVGFVSKVGAGAIVAILFFFSLTTLSPKVGIDNTSNVVLADQIGKIINAQGQVSLVNNGKKVEENFIKDGDKIVLGFNSQIIFDINKSTKARIVGPAEVLVKYVGVSAGVKNYVLTLIDGTYIEVNSEKNSKNNILVKTDQFDIEPAKVQDKTSFSIANAGKQKLVQNRGGEIIIKNKQTEQKTRITTSVKSNQIARITEQETRVSGYQPITITLDSGTPSAMFAMSEEEKKFFESSSTTISRGTGENVTLSGIKNNDINSGGNTVKQRKILSLGIAEKVDSLLSKESINTLLEDIHTNSSTESCNKLREVLVQVAGLYDIGYQFGSNEKCVIDLGKSVSGFLVKIQDEYYVGPEHSLVLSLIVSKLGK